MEMHSMQQAQEYVEQAACQEPVQHPSSTTITSADQSKQTDLAGREPKHPIFQMQQAFQEVSLYQPTDPAVKWETADPKMQQVAEMLWEKLRQDPAFEALEACEWAVMRHILHAQNLISVGTCWTH